jgi:hypothetical protein
MEKSKTVILVQEQLDTNQVKIQKLITILNQQVQLQTKGLRLNNYVQITLTKKPKIITVSKEFS